ncbi:DUF971 domain-containing protein [Haloferula sargassicola]|uniref:Gamma-butyrobetaine hydroxylase-like N-terminal domain-containing protein n=1 Tax=Haloferula sargassicola TaxID=490096 RepID=A0ABP9UIJ9_9BACT
MKLEHCAVIGGELALAFDDGFEAYLPLLFLRRACPCAECQGEPDALGRVVVPETSIGDRGCEIAGMDQVGGYGLQIRWADGHSNGIYSYPLLRQLAAALEN